MIFCIKVWCNSIFEGNIISRGYPTKLENYGNSRGWGYDKRPLEWKFQGVGGSETKVLFVGAGDMDIFWNYRILGIRMFSLL